MIASSAINNHTNNSQASTHQTTSNKKKTILSAKTPSSYRFTQALLYAYKQLNNSYQQSAQWYGSQKQRIFKHVAQKQRQTVRFFQHTYHSTITKASSICNSSLQTLKDTRQYLVDLLSNTLKPYQETWSLFRRSGEHYSFINLIITAFLTGSISLLIAPWFTLFHNQFSFGTDAILQSIVLVMCMIVPIQSIIIMLIESITTQIAINQGMLIFNRLLECLNPTYQKLSAVSEHKDTTDLANNLSPEKLTDYFIKINQLTYKLVSGVTQTSVVCFYMYQMGMLAPFMGLIGVMAITNFVNARVYQYTATIEGHLGTVENSITNITKSMIDKPHMHLQQIQFYQDRYQQAEATAKHYHEQKSYARQFKRTYEVIPRLLQQLTTPVFSLVALIYTGNHLPLTNNQVLTPGLMGQILFASNAMWRFLGGIMVERSDDISKVISIRTTLYNTLTHFGINHSRQPLAYQTSINTSQLMSYNLVISATISTALIPLTHMIVLFKNTIMTSAMWALPALQVASILSIASIAYGLLSYWHHRNSDASTQPKTYWDIQILSNLCSIVITQGLFSCACWYSAVPQFWAWTSLSSPVTLACSALQVGISLTCSLFLANHKYPKTNQIHSETSKKSSPSRLTPRPQVSAASSISLLASPSPKENSHIKINGSLLRKNRHDKTNHSACNKDSISWACHLSDLDIQTGSNCLIVGENGTGKSSIIQSIFETYNSNHLAKTRKTPSLSPRTDTSSITTSCFLGQPYSSYFEGLENICLKGGFLGIPQDDFGFMPEFSSPSSDQSSTQPFQDYTYLQYLMARFLNPSQRQHMIQNWSQHQNSILEFLTQEVCDFTEPNHKTTPDRASYNIMARLITAKSSTDFNRDAASGGEKQQINASIYQELIKYRPGHTPYINTLILDEPLAQTDKKIRPKILRSLIKEAKTHTTLICVLHEESNDYFKLFEQGLVLKEEKKSTSSTPHVNAEKFDPTDGKSLKKLFRVDNVKRISLG